MVQELKELLKNSYSPYSHFPVASILITKDGRKYKGVNVEDASTRAGSCAERSAIFSAISDGVKKGEFKEINIMVDNGDISTPCFVCRQMLLELFDQDAIVRCFSSTGSFKEYTVKELTPYPFGADDLI
jgi:cytidine deaminase